MKFEHRTLPSFWTTYQELPEDLRRRADKQYELLASNPTHPSLRLKPVGDLWSVRVSDGYRALALRELNTFTWFWIGSHDDYERLLKN